MTTPVAPVLSLAPTAASPGAPRRHVVKLHPPVCVPGHDAPLELAGAGLRLSAPSGERVVGLVPCALETERALDALPITQSAADAAEQRVYVATLFMLGWSAVVILLPGMWVAAALAMFLLVAAVWRFSVARATLGAARERAQARLGAEGCFPPEIRFLTSPVADLTSTPASAVRAAPASQPPAPRLHLVR